MEVPLLVEDLEDQVVEVQEHLDPHLYMVQIKITDKLEQSTQVVVEVEQK